MVPDADSSRRKEVRSKERLDPLTTINTLLSKHPSTSTSSHTHHRHNTNSAPNASSSPTYPLDALQAARLSREKSERERALALIAKAKAPKRGIWNDTPSTVAGGRTWGEELEREKDRAGRRFFGGSETPSGASIASISTGHQEARGGGARDGYRSSDRDRDRAWDAGRSRGGRTWDI